MIPKTKFLTAGLVAASLCASSTAAAAAASPSRTLASSLAASCTASVAAAGAAAAQAATRPGCVLPAVDALAVVEPVVPPPVYVPESTTAGPGIGTLPLLLGLAAIAGALWLLLDDKNDDNIDLPMTRG